MVKSSPQQRKGTTICGCGGRISLALLLVDAGEPSGGAWPESAATAQTLTRWRQRARAETSRRGSVGDQRRAQRHGGGGAGSTRARMEADGGRTTAHGQVRWRQTLIRV
jgi:hypothetical protein